ncbi:unnamed protein product [Euphydryas editha]|uniref:Uncharacterized protein n=1 Tax=Euphydryas editha TaxID=104508 RepID=A0AAU9UVX1_EUPED|nr:unnamed protein product [Euphydryas editha]
MWAKTNIRVSQPQRSARVYLTTNLLDLDTLPNPSTTSRSLTTPYLLESIDKQTRGCGRRLLRGRGHHEGGLTGYQGEQRQGHQHWGHGGDARAYHTRARCASTPARSCGLLKRTAAGPSGARRGTGLARRLHPPKLPCRPDYLNPARLRSLQVRATPT